jgi:hypothetical protein
MNEKIQNDSRKLIFGIFGQKTGVFHRSKSLSTGLALAWASRNAVPFLFLKVLDMSRCLCYNYACRSETAEGQG